MFTPPTIAGIGRYPRDERQKTVIGGGGGGGGARTGVQNWSKVRLENGNDYLGFMRIMGFF